MRRLIIYCGLLGLFFAALLAALIAPSIRGYVDERSAVVAQERLQDAIIFEEEGAARLSRLEVRRQRNLWLSVAVTLSAALVLLSLAVAVLRFAWVLPRLATQKASLISSPNARFLLHQVEDGLAVYDLETGHNKLLGVPSLPLSELLELQREGGAILLSAQE